MSVNLATLLWIAFGAVLPARADEVITTPIRTFGLGRLQDVAYSPDGRHIATCGT